MPEKADAHLLGIKVGGLQEGRQTPTSPEAKYVGGRAESKYAKAFSEYEDLYINVILPAIPEDTPPAMRGMLRSVGYNLYKRLKNITDSVAAAAERDAVVARFTSLYGDALEDAITSVASAVMIHRGFT